MTRHLVIFAVACALGAAISVIVRTASHRPYAEPQVAMPMAVNGSVATPDAMTAAPSAAAAQSADHPAHAAPPAASPVATSSATVNTICPGCGDPINPTLPYADYKGHKIGFGCAMCPSKLKADPVKYGEAALKNQLAD